MTTAEIQQILKNYGHSDARSAIHGKPSHEWARALTDAGFGEAANVVSGFVPNPSLNDMQLGAAASPWPTPPPGKAALRSLDEWEALPTEAERQARMDEVDVLLRMGAK